MVIKLNEIIITEDFRKSIPNCAKFFDKYSYYKRTRDLKGKIILNDYNELIDGYVCYLITKMFDIEEVIVEYVDEMDEHICKMISELKYRERKKYFDKN